MKAFLWIFLLVAAHLSAEMNVLVFAGSTRADSYNKKLARHAAHTARKLGAKVTLVELNDFVMPFYCADFEEKHGMPAAAKRLRKLMVESDAVIIATPEYNGSIPAVLKNAIDWASREDGERSFSAFEGKTFALMSASPGRRGGARAVAHLRFIVEELGGIVLQNELSIANARDAFNKEGMLADAQFLQEQIQELIPKEVSKN